MLYWPKLTKHLTLQRVTLYAPVENDSDEDDDEAEHSELAHSSATSELHAKTYRRLKQEIVTRWNSALEMINSLLSMKDEVSEALKRTGNYTTCF